MRIDGGCHCGAIAYGAVVDPGDVSICHCTDCQTLTGSAFRVTALCDGGSIAMTRGSPKIYAKRGGSGRISYQHFCGDCGTPLFFGGTERLNGPAGIRWGSIAQRRELPPTSQIWCRSALDWIDRLAALPSRDGD